MPKVSVVIPFYERVDWLEEAVNSVLGQTFDDYEIIVVNDGSKEDTSSFLERHGKEIIYIEKENGGPSTARNEGIKHSKGDYIAFLDSDDLWLPNKLEIQLKYMVEYNALWSYCGYQTFGQCSSNTYRMTASKTPIMQRYNTPYIATPCVVIKREYLLQHPKIRFNPSLRYGQDSYFWLMINADNSILAIPEILVKVRMRGGNASKRARIQLQARSNVWRFRKDNSGILIDKFNLSKLYKIASELCVISDSIIRRIEKKVNNKKMVEYISKLLFILPWVTFKIDALLFRKSKSE